MQFIDLAKQQGLIKDSLDKRIQDVLAHGKYIMGPEVREMEAQLADYVGVKYCVSCSSGTDALLMPLLAWDVGPGDAIFTTPFTFIATAEVIQLLGATPVFVDIDPQTYTQWFNPTAYSFSAQQQAAQAAGQNWFNPETWTQELEKSE